MELLKKLGARALDYLRIIISISGFVVAHATIIRTVAMFFALLLTFIFSRYYFGDRSFSLIYGIVTTTIYMSFIYSVLHEKGLRHWFIKNYGGEQKGYRAYEGMLGFIFFVQGASIGYISSAFSGEQSSGALLLLIAKPVAVVMFIAGFIIKVWATKVVSVDIYYWKDMFLGRRISNFVVAGPYKYMRNPMYGLGHLQVYAVAVWYLSLTGLIAAAINQLAIFSFYFLREKKFIRRVYQTKVIPMHTYSASKAKP